VQTLGSWRHSGIAIALATVSALAGCTQAPGPEPARDGDTATSAAVTDIRDGIRAEPPRADGAADTSRACGGSAAVIDGGGAGEVRIGMSTSELRLGCEVLGDTTLSLEGQRQPAVLVGIRGETIVAETIDDRVWRIRVAGPGLATADSLRVGMPANRLAEYRDARVVTGEGTDVVIVPEHCGLSFVVEGLPFRSGGWTAGALAELPDDVRIESILIFGCDAGTS